MPMFIWVALTICIAMFLSNGRLMYSIVQFGHLCVNIKNILLLFFELGSLIKGIVASFIKTIFAFKRTEARKKLPYTTLEKETLKRFQEQNLGAKKISSKKPVFISRNVDDVIEEILNYLLRDYIISWYGYIVKDSDYSSKLVKEQAWDALFAARKRLRQMDEVKFIVCDVVNIVTEHFQNMRNAVINSSEKSFPYKVYPFLYDKDEELNHLRKVTEFFLMISIPRKLVSYLPVRHLLKEALVTMVIYPLLDKICDPDWINLKLRSVVQNLQEAEKHNRTYAYAETYEDFVKMIQECGSIEALQRMRYYIVTEIMQATTMSNLKRSKGIDAGKEFNPQKTNKGDLLQSRNLSRYLNQLRFAKGLCEKRLRLLGSSDFAVTPRGSGQILLGDKIVNIPCRKVLSMSVIIQSPFCRRHFSRYLQREEMHSLLGYWEAVEDMKQTDKVLWHKLGNDIVQVYVHNQSSNVRLNKNTLKGIEEFIMGNKGPEAFFRSQDEVHKQLEENCYASFIVSDVYHKMLAEAEKCGIDFTQDNQEVQDMTEPSDSSSPTEKNENDEEVSVFDHSSYARSQLKILQEKLSDKIQALHALRNNPRCEKKVIMMLNREIEDLKMERNLLESHIEKTELWIKYLGIWNATVMDFKVVKEDEKIVPYFNVLVHLASHPNHMSEENIGWIVPRNLSAFHILHQKLVPAAAWLKKVDLPTKPRFKSFDKNYLDRVKIGLQTFLAAVTKDDGLNKSEALYSFLNPSPGHVKHPLSATKKHFKFNIFQLFKGVQNSFGQLDDAEDEELLFLDDTDSKDDKKDSIAEPIYSLIGELFELKGVFNWIRKTLIMFVQVTYGQTINRQIRETVSYFLSEPMLLHYVQIFRDTMWPHGKLAAPTPHRTKTQKLETRIQTKEMLINSIPEILNILMGHQNNRKGATKIFESLQNKTLNKQLVYNIVEAFMYDFAPEILKKKEKGIMEGIALVFDSDF